MLEEDFLLHHHQLADTQTGIKTNTNEMIQKTVVRIMNKRGNYYDTGRTRKENSSFRGH